MSNDQAIQKTMPPISDAWLLCALRHDSKNCSSVLLWFVQASQSASETFRAKNAIPSSEQTEVQVEVRDRRRFSVQRHDGLMQSLTAFWSTFPVAIYDPSTVNKQPIEKRSQINRFPSHPPNDSTKSVHLKRHPLLPSKLLFHSSPLKVIHKWWKPLQLYLLFWPLRHVVMDSESLPLLLLEKYLGTRPCEPKILIQIFLVDATFSYTSF